MLPELFAQISGWQSALMMQWYKKVDASKLEILFLAALLQEMGKNFDCDEVVKNDGTCFTSRENETMRISPLLKRCLWV